jgi:hypothetical protein
LKRRIFGRSVKEIIVLEPMETPVMHKSFRGTLTAEDRRVMRNWTRGVVIVYGALALIVFGLASLSQHFGNGSKGPAATAVTTAAADKNQRHR